MKKDVSILNKLKDSIKDNSIEIDDINIKTLVTTSELCELYDVAQNNNTSNSYYIFDNLSISEAEKNLIYNEYKRRCVDSWCGNSLYLFENMIGRTIKNIVYPGLNSCIGITLSINGCSIGSHFLVPDEIGTEKYKIYVKNLKTISDFYNSYDQQPPSVSIYGKTPTDITSHFRNFTFLKPKNTIEFNEHLENIKLLVSLIKKQYIMTYKINEFFYRYDEKLDFYELLKLIFNMRKFPGVTVFDLTEEELKQKFELDFELNTLFNDTEIDSQIHYAIYNKLAGNMRFKDLNGLTQFEEDVLSGKKEIKYGEVIS